MTLTSMNTISWEKYWKTLYQKINHMSELIKNEAEIDEITSYITHAYIIQFAAKEAIPETKPSITEETSYPSTIKELEKQRRIARKRWQCSCISYDKAHFNRIYKKLSKRYEK